MSRIRTIGKCIEELQAIDPNTCITVWNIRQLIKNGKINFWMSGNRKLVDMDQVEAYFNYDAQRSHREEIYAQPEEFIVPIIHRK